MREGFLESKLCWLQRQTVWAQLPSVGTWGRGAQCGGQAPWSEGGSSVIRVFSGFGVAHPGLWDLTLPSPTPPILLAVAPCLYL